MKASLFECIECGADYSQWVGRCNLCGEWNSVQERVKEKFSGALAFKSAKAEALAEINLEQAQQSWQSGVKEFDRVLGAGIMPGSVGLLGGAPGVGKSTLILQLLSRFAKVGKQVLYVSGEETALQIKNRADRLNIEQQKIHLLTAFDLGEVEAVLANSQPDFIVIDSIQTLYSSQFTGVAGSVSQVKETAARLIQLAKLQSITIMLIGHITKEGQLAGPKVLEHMVDYVLYLETESQPNLRILRSVKNRFGSLAEVGLFKMTSHGLAEIKNPNQTFAKGFEERTGTAVYLAREGSRSLLVEVQALVGENSQTYPARTAVGLERNRLMLLLALIEKYLGLNLQGLDVYLNLAGGWKPEEPTVDMAVIAAVLSSYLNIAFKAPTVFFGEVALTGVFQQHSSWQDQIKEAARCGCLHAVVPVATKVNSGLKVHVAANIVALHECLLELKTLKI